MLKKGVAFSLGKLFKGGGSTNYEFSTSNPMWRATLDILDFLPLSYSRLFWRSNYFRLVHR